MQEFSTLALVLEVKQTGEQDGRVILYTELLGKVAVRAKSLFAPNSKLAGHLQPLMLSRVRLVEKKGVQVVDALAEKAFISAKTKPLVASEFINASRLINEMAQPFHPDAELWDLIIRNRLVSAELLRVLGFDSAHASCNQCQQAQPKHFLLRDMVYLCSKCFVGMYGSTHGTNLGVSVS